MAVVCNMSDAGPAAEAETAANRELWTQVNAEYGDEHARQAWATDDITWGIFNIPERQLGVLGEVSGLDVVELGCGTAYFSARLLRPRGRLVFHTTSVLVTLCLPVSAGHAGQQLLRPQRDISSRQLPGHGVEFHPSHGEWVKVLRSAGFAVDELHELYAPLDASDHPYYRLAPPNGLSGGPSKRCGWHI
jgi:hypothetical protein